MSFFKKFFSRKFLMAVTGEVIAVVGLFTAVDPAVETACTYVAGAIPVVYGVIEGAVDIFRKEKTIN